jgi:alpha-galactosidase
MATDIKIAIIGAGSAQFSGGIVRDLCVNPGLQGSHITFMDIDDHRLDMVTRLAKRIAGEIGADLSFSRTLDRQEALRGADFVINTAQVGGHDWTEAQRQMAERYGYYRGVRLHDFGQALFFLEVARDVERICPNAWLLQSANPVFEGCTLMHRETTVKVVGLCHGHYGYRHIARILGLDPADVCAQMPGFNHWIWMTDFRYKGEDAYPLLDAWIERDAEAYWAKDGFAFSDTQMSRAAIHQYRLFGLMPIGDTPRFAGWWYHPDLATKQRWYGALGGFDSEMGWQHYLDRMAQNVSKVERAAIDPATAATDTFAPVQSDEQIVPMIHSLVNDDPRLFQVNIPNRGPILPGFPEDLVIECQGLVDGGGIRGVSVPPLPAKLVVSAMIPRWQRTELVVEALRQADRDLLLHYLLVDARTQTLEQAESLLDEWLSDRRNQQVATLFGRG